MNIFGYPEEIDNWATREDKHPQCPFCHGHATEWLDIAKGSIEWSFYLCYTCQVKFIKHEPVPFMKEHPCHSK